MTKTMIVTPAMIDRARALLLRRKEVPGAFVHTRGELLAQVCAIVEMLDEHFDVKAFDHKHLWVAQGPRSYQARKTLEVDWARKVIDDALAHLDTLKPHEDPPEIVKAAKELEGAYGAVVDAAHEFYTSMDLRKLLKHQPPSEVKVPGYRLADLADAVRAWKDAGQALLDLQAKQKR